MADLEIQLDHGRFRKLERFLSLFPRTLSKDIARAEAKTAEWAAEEVRRLAPVETGLYRSTIEAHGSQVTTSHPASNRLEHGFVGVDSLGRHYSNPAQPHFEPVRELLRKKFPEDIHKFTRRELRKYLRTV